jgi:hypothetical protein
MAIAFVNAAIGGTEAAGSVSSIAATAIAATTGNVIVACVRFFGGTSNSVTDTAGNSYASLGSVTNGNSVKMYMAYNITGHATNVVTANFTSGTYTSLSVVQYSGLATAASPSNVFSTNSGSTAAPTSLSFSTSVAEELVVAFVTCNGGGFHQTQDIGGVAANARAVNTQNTLVFDRLTTTGPLSSITASTSLSASDAWAFILSTFTPPAAAAGQPTQRRGMFIPGMGKKFGGIQ